jgi:AAHS family 4-hydroxybenzoate transporter-like MFS transporter
MTEAKGAEVFGWREAGVFALIFLALISDGFDLQAMGFAAPALVRDWGTSRAALGPALSAGLVGILVGAPAFGWFGDRYGRKRAIVIGSVIYGVFSLATAATGSIGELIFVRFLTGLGLGGVVPNAIALTAELASARRRALQTAMVTVGISLGGVIAGLVAASLMPTHGWRVLFIVGGVAPLGIAVLVQLLLPESPQLRAQLAKTAEAEQAPTRGGGLFAGQFRLITPMIWLLFGGNLMTLFLLTSWLPVVMESGGMSPQSAALMSTLMQFGGVIGGIIASLLLPRVKLPLVAILTGGAWLISATLAVTPMPDIGLAAMLGLAGMCVLGCQNAINAMAGLLYPARIRARGVGMALAIGRIGSISGPLIGAAAIGLGASGRQDLFLLPLIPLGVGFIASIVIIRHCRLGDGEEPAGFRA